MPKKLNTLSWLATGALVTTIAACDKMPDSEADACRDSDPVPSQIQCEIRAEALLDEQTLVVKFEDGTESKPLMTASACLAKGKGNPQDMAMGELNAESGDFVLPLIVSITFGVCSGVNGTPSHQCVDLCTPVVCSSVGNFGPQPSKPIGVYSTIEDAEASNAISQGCSEGKNPEDIVAEIMAN